MRKNKSGGTKTRVMDMVFICWLIFAAGVFCISEYGNKIKLGGWEYFFNYEIESDTVYPVSRLNSPMRFWYMAGGSPYVTTKGVIRNVKEDRHGLFFYLYEFDGEAIACYMSNSSLENNPERGYLIKKASEGNIIVHVGGTYLASWRNTAIDVERVYVP